jgi:hypothetical protein
VVNNVSDQSDQSARACEEGSGARRGVHVVPTKTRFLRQDEALVKRGTAIDRARRANPAHGKTLREISQYRLAMAVTWRRPRIRWASGEI